MVLEGRPLDYFKNENNRIAYCNGNSADWWLRSPNTYYLSCTYYISSSGKICSTNASDLNGIRPAFSVSNQMKIKLCENIDDNDKVYVFSIEK